METINIDILNPKAKNLLKELASLKLIKINKERNKTDFTEFIKKLRSKSTEDLSLEEISKEVDEVRKNRYEK
jgi:hypothetical protein